MKSRLTAVALIVVLAAMPAVPGTAAPLAGPCLAGAVYDPACDVDHDGDIDLRDIQRTAGHWNQTGVWTSDNSHDHLGQTWAGAGNPLAIGGAYISSPLSLSNTTGDGLRIPLAGEDGLEIGTVGNDGVRVNSAGAYGVWVDSAGLMGFHVGSANLHGLQIGSAGDSGITVSSAGGTGMWVGSTGEDGFKVVLAGDPSGSVGNDLPNGFYVSGAEGYGVYVGRADIDGVAVDSAGLDGFDVNSAGDAGIEAGGTNWAGYFDGNILVTGSCFGCLLATFAVNTGDAPLAPGDVAALVGLGTSSFDNSPLLLEVVPAAAGQPLVGVVTGRAELVTDDDPQPGETGRRLVAREGAATPGDYVTVVYAGPVRVNVGDDEGIRPGALLTAGNAGQARVLGLVAVSATDGSGVVQVPESVPVLGMALQPPAADGTVWVLVNAW